MASTAQQYENVDESQLTTTRFWLYRHIKCHIKKIIISSPVSHSIFFWSDACLGWPKFASLTLIFTKKIRFGFYSQLNYGKYIYRVFSSNFFFGNCVFYFFHWVVHCLFNSVGKVFMTVTVVLVTVRAYDRYPFFDIIFWSTFLLPGWILYQLGKILIQSGNRPYFEIRRVL